MRRKARTRTRLMVAFVAVASMMFALLPATPAAASEIKIAIAGIATLNAGFMAPCTANEHIGSFTGTGTGTHGTTLYADADVTANFMYCNYATAIGTAEGTLTIQGGLNGNLRRHTCNFTWVRSVHVDMTLSGCRTSAGAHTPSGGKAALTFALIDPPDTAPARAALAGEWIF